MHLFLFILVYIFPFSIELCYALSGLVHHGADVHPKALAQHQIL